MADIPSMNEINKAKDLLLDELLADFPFASQADRANAVAWLLLPLIRPSIDGPTPLHLIEAPIQGTGKGTFGSMYRPDSYWETGARNDRGKGG